MHLCTSMHVFIISKAQHSTFFISSEDSPQGRNWSFLCPCNDDLSIKQEVHKRIILWLRLSNLKVTLRETEFVVNFPQSVKLMEMEVLSLRNGVTSLVSVLEICKRLLTYKVNVQVLREKYENWNKYIWNSYASSALRVVISVLFKCLFLAAVSFNSALT
jgi:hypothetical protein